MLLSIVVNLSSSVNGTQSASQAASPLLHHGGATQPPYSITIENAYAATANAPNHVTRQ